MFFKKVPDRIKTSDTSYIPSPYTKKDVAVKQKDIAVNSWSEL